VLKNHSLIAPDVHHGEMLLSGVMQLAGYSYT